MNQKYMHDAIDNLNKVSDELLVTINISQHIADLRVRHREKLERAAASVFNGRCLAQQRQDADHVLPARAAKDVQLGALVAPLPGGVEPLVCQKR